MTLPTPLVAVDCVVGTRPEAVKMAPVIRALACQPWASLRVIATGQHRELAADVLDFFGVPVDVDLAALRAGQSLNELHARLLIGFDALWSERAPDVVVAQGDTTSVLAAAQAAFHRGLAFAHVEAGLRSPRADSPFPEEMNRRLMGRLAELHFAPTRAAAENLRREGVPPAQISVTGNPVVDALEWTLKRHVPPPRVPAGKKLILVTAHRRENHGRRLDEICAAVRDLAARSDAFVLWPLHPNPAVRERVRKLLAVEESVQLAAPLAYPDFIAALNAAHVVLSDSGGVQEEALALGTPLLVLRDETERLEAIAAGGAKLVGARRERIVSAAAQLLDEPAAYAQMAQVRFPFGTGDAATRIVCALRDRFAASAAVQGWAAQLRSGADRARSGQQPPRRRPATLQTATAQHELAAAHGPSVDS